MNRRKRWPQPNWRAAGVSPLMGWARLVVRNIYNGTVLWKTDLPDNFYALRSAFAATTDTFYLLDANKCLRYDAATGKPKPPLVIGKSDEMLQWMALDGDMIVALAGPKVHYSPGGKTYPDLKNMDQSVKPWVFGNTLYGYDLNQQKVVWQHSEKLPIDALATGLSDGKLFYYVHGSHLGCLRASSGSQLWKNADEKLFGETYKTTKLSFAKIRSGFCNLLSTKDYVFLDPATKRTLSAFDAKSGELLWTAPRGNTRFTSKMLFADGTLLANNVSSGSQVMAFNPLTGEKSPKRIGAGACTRITGCNGEIFTRNSFNTRATCVEGVIPASGMLYMSAYACGCNYQLLGYQALGAGKPDLVEFAKNVTDRLQVYRKDLLNESGEAAGDGDWPLYRANQRRSSATGVSIAEIAKQRWRSEPSQEHLPTPPIVVGDRVFVGGSDGVVRCVDARTGKPIWHYGTGGPLIAAPTYWNGSVYVGSGDGRVYRLTAKTGDCIWRFQVAPRERRIRVYGTLSSTWPVNSGVLIHKGTAFVAAGITARNGTAVVVLDAQTGSLKWENLTCGEQNRISAIGSLVAVDNQIILSGGRSASIAAFDAATGKVNKVYPLGVRGFEMGLLGDNTLVFGGRPLYSPQNVVQASGKSDSIRLLDLTMGRRPVALGRRNSLFPVWDGDVFVHSQTGLTGLIGRFRQKDGQFKITPAATTDAPGTKPTHWGPIAGSFISTAVAGNVVIATRQSKNKQREDVFHLAAYSKKDGKQVWMQTLDGKPKLDGLAIGRDGNIVVTFDDGAIESYGQ